MSKGSEIVFAGLGLIIVSLTIVAIAAYYGETDWTWIAQTNTLFLLVLLTLLIALSVLVSWSRGK